MAMKRSMNGKVFPEKGNFFPPEQTVAGERCALSLLRPTFESNYVVSRLGGYVIRHFMSNMTFLENVMMDTFIPNSEAWIELCSLTTQIYSVRDTIEKLKIRKKRVLHFFSTMRELYAPLHVESIRRGLSREWCADPFLASTHQLTTNLEKAMRSAERNYGPQAIQH
jgi:hypothetical protein